MTDGGFQSVVLSPVLWNHPELVSLFDVGESDPHQNTGSRKALVWLSFVFPDSSGGEESARKAGGAGSIPGLGRYPGEGHGRQPTSVFFPGESQATVHRVEKSQTGLRD